MLRNVIKITVVKKKKRGKKTPTVFEFGRRVLDSCTTRKFSTGKLDGYSKKGVGRVSKGGGGLTNQDSSLFKRRRTRANSC